ncbi:tRNA(Ile)-lysidine synthetase-like protein [Rubrobacter xylanophilus DSM 9941]|uniref:tRNA(Ile)-lysidine synthase n=1 Tax=Rubrobacter xylanophilus (strain DSM 9941 / JCM 11954 / NBRC 16129 / PRD-1) TaxID=266117 RepID=Q1ATZ7_RUBXD|nr:tRNA lysidine(34) synthetase TilS [Rubrobacter xylanophilus]ABG05131.1 tRNA(Ile)-lysidine synthetase-like protein [Rubrobacter xylanophilus DSM 9941]
MEPGAFQEAVLETVRRYGMDLSRPLALVSGGPDSVALLRALVGLGYEPAVLHVDHGLRGEESRGDAEFVRELCRGLGLRCEVRSLRLEGRAGLQERARRERYRIAGEVAGRLGASAVAVGHNADDVAETLLLNLARGSGLRGLSGIPPVRGRVCRPLIERTRAEILGYLEALGQGYRVDSTNLLPKYARNRVRLEVMPVLEELHPGAVRNMARAAALLREDLAALEELAAGVVREEGGEAGMSVAELDGLPPALRRYAVRRAYAAVAPEAPPLPRRLVEAVLELARGGGGTRLLDLPGGVVAAARFGERLVLYRREEGEAGERPLVAGESLRFAGWRVRADEVEGMDPEDARRPEVAYLDAGRGPYRVRTVREGDTIRPLGLGGTKKVMRAMMDRKVPKDLRRRTPVVVDPEGRVAWVFLGELGEDFRVRETTEKVLRVEVERA